MEEIVAHGEVGPQAAQPVQAEGKDLGHPDIVKGLGELPQGAIVTAKGLADIFGCHICSIRRAVGRGELPEPTRFMGASVWLAGTIIEHLKVRQEAAAKQREKEKMRIRNLSI